MLRLVLLAAATTLLAAPANAADPVVIAGPGGATMVGATKGWTAWSERQRGATAWRLVVRAPIGLISRPAVKPSSVPFDIDLGTDASGEVIAAYSRCKTEPVATGGANPRAGGGLPQYTTGKGCSIRILNLTTAEELTVPRPGSDESDVLPSLSGSKLAYVAVRKAPRYRRAALLMVRDQKTRKRTLLHSGGRLRGSVTTAEGPTSVDTDGRSVTSAWRHRNRRDQSFDTDVLLQPIKAHEPTLVASATNTSDTPFVTLLAPTLNANRVTYLLTFGTGFCARRYAKGRRYPAYGIERSSDTASPLSAAVDGNRLVVSEVYANSRSPFTPIDNGQIVDIAQGRFTDKARPGELCG